jgi:hypothetical protein
MNKEFVPYEESLELKELGFDEECLKYWNDFGKTSTYMRFQLLNGIDDWCQDYIKAPLYSQAFRWFREKYNLHVNKTGNNYYTSFNMVEPKIEILSFVRYTDTENHYEESELACLKKLIEIVKNNE